MHRPCAELHEPCVRGMGFIKKMRLFFGKEVHKFFRQTLQAIAEYAII